ncbi:MFS transporter [Nocardioides sp.]|uniref:MFS transporter n=1 Tax=Nocardioides sp. TaxID=35761 RepID=UPI002ED08D9F
MTTSPTTGHERAGILAPAYLATTIAVFALIAFNAFEAMAVTTVMPTISRDLDGLGLYALAFAAPLASGVVGMVAAGQWSDRRGPATPLLVSLVLFSIGVLTCGLAPSMEVLVGGRVVQGLGTGALIVSLYVVVGVVYPARLQPSIFASFAAAWVLPSLFGPAVAALVADVFGWRWVFLGVVALVALAAALLAPVVPALRTWTAEDGAAAPRTRLAWAVGAAVMVLAVELLGSSGFVLAAVPAIVLVLVAIRPLTPRGTLLAGRGLPSVIGTRGLMSAAFFCCQAYVVLALQELWGLSPGQAGIALTVVGVVWASASQLQARLRDHLTSERAMQIGTAMLLGAAALLWVSVWQHLSFWLAGGAFVIAGAGMGLGFTRTGVAMLAASSDTDRGFNSSALSIADSLGAALALSLCGIGFTAATEAGGDPFLAVFGVAIVCAIGAVVTASRTPCRPIGPSSAPV